MQLPAAYGVCLALKMPFSMDPSGHFKAIIEVTYASINIPKEALSSQIVVEAATTTTPSVGTTFPGLGRSKCRRHCLYVQQLPIWRWHIRQMAERAASAGVMLGS